MYSPSHNHINRHGVLLQPQSAAQVMPAPNKCSTCQQLLSPRQEGLQPRSLKSAAQQCQLHCANHS